MPVSLLSPQVPISFNGRLVAGDESGDARGTNSVDIQSTRTAATRVASGYESVAVGLSNTSSGSYSVAVGKANTSSGTGAVSVGISNTASSSYTLSLGAYVIVSQDHATSICYASTASGRYSTSVGVYNLASGRGSSSFGYSTTASGAYSSSFGYANNATATRSVAVGYKVKVSTNNVTEIGNWNLDVTRGGSVRMHRNGMVGITVQDKATAYTDGGTSIGSEADDSLGRGMFTIRRNGTTFYLDYNDGGTVKTLTLGTVS